MTIEQLPLTEKQLNFIRRFSGLTEPDITTITPAVGKRLIDLTTALWDRKITVPPVVTHYRKKK